MLEHLIDIAELERRTAIKQATLRKYVAQRKIPFVKIGRLVRFDLSEIESWIRERKVPVLKGAETVQVIPENGRLDFQETSKIEHFTRFFPAN
ncbi:MAG: helix-turn-helix domain-containing protein [Spirochaetaceae bacterium]|jgi:excisionase family DNA binding protein|nr:helix-turn-helix domain-containing protein [Spirochaetaceae bacterium]